MNSKNAAYWIEHLQLSTHVEGGAFREVYRSPMQIPDSVLPPEFKGPRSCSTSIYFLLQAGQFSALHRIASDELWHFYAGDTLEIFEIQSNGELLIHRLGAAHERGEHFQVLIRAGSWFGSRVSSGSEYVLAGCTVAPGFDFEDFELARAEELLKVYPQHEAVIRSLC